MGNKTIVVNIFGGPGVGKSILGFDVVSAIKREFISCDLSPEFIKTKLREKSEKAISNQIFIFGNQQFQLYVLKDEVKVIITDSPILLCTIYDKDKSAHLKGLIYEEHNKYHNLNYLLLRNDKVPYEQEGRYQNIDGAKEVDTKVLDFLNAENIPYKTVHGLGLNTIMTILTDVKEELAKR